MEKNIENRVLQPLSFIETKIQGLCLNNKIKCLLCSDIFNLNTDLNNFLKHLFEKHKLIIEDFQNISKFDKYIEFWNQKFLEKPIEFLIPCVNIENTNQSYFILSNLLKDDKYIRHKLKLESAMEQQEIERTSNIFKKVCLFCKFEYEGNIYGYVKHLSENHNLQLGKPENLVYINDFLTEIELKITKLQCIYCEKFFTDRNVLKEHMRKKLHKRINSSNNFYDKFYIVNYLEADKNWAQIQKEEDILPITLEENSDNEYSDWLESASNINCLFCEFTDSALNTIIAHLKNVHSFDFENIITSLEYYQRVKLVNYVRRQIYILNCIRCNKHFDNKNDLLGHMESEMHFGIPEVKIFDQPEYYFPTYENDTLLYFLDDIID